MTEAVRSLLAPLAGDVALYRAPGRVNLIGDHTDYNDGLVMPVAVDRFTWVAIQRRSDRRLRLYSANVDASADLDLQAPLMPTREWSDYAVGVAVALQRRGIEIAGLDIRIYSDIPMGAGLSSSAALEVAVAYGIADIGRAHVDPMALAELCRDAENTFVGARVGLMDQFIAAHGIAGHAVFLDCRSLAFRPVPLPRGVTLVVCNSMVRHDHASGGYNRRRDECEQALRRLQTIHPRIASLRDIRVEDLERLGTTLPPIERQRVRHVVSENERVQQTAAALAAGDLECVARCMAESHRSLRDDYEVSTPELDLLVKLASARRGVHGARMTGGGFGGCTVNLVDDAGVASFVAEVSRSYEDRTGIAPQILACSSADGVRRIPLI
jgi:galactokinase